MVAKGFEHVDRVHRTTSVYLSFFVCYRCWKVGLRRQEQRLLLRLEQSFLHQNQNFVWLEVVRSLLGYVFF